MARSRRSRARARRAAASNSGLNSKQRRLARPLHCEHLEDRRLLAVVTVDTPLDVFDVNDGKTSLREAIFATNTVPGADEIRFDFGHDGPETILLTQGELAITDSLTITGLGADLLTIDASGNDPTPFVRHGDGSGIFNINDNDPGRSIDVTIDGLTITGVDTFLGGGILSRENLSLFRSNIVGNYRGSGVGVYQATGVLSIVGTTIKEHYGAGVYVLLAKQVTISDSLIAGNRSGGISVVNSDLTTIRSTIRGNEAAYGGGVRVFRSKFSLIDSLVVDNKGRWGAGILVENGLDQSLVTSILQSTITNNQGAGVYIYRGPLRISHSTVTQNVFGVRDPSATLVPIDITSSIISGNGTDVWTTATSNAFVSHGHNLVGAGPAIAAFNQPGDLVGVDPLLAPLADNGGPTWTHALLPGSPAIDAGDPTLRPGEGDALEFDQRGAPFTRGAGARIDIGAFELQAAGGALNADFDFSGATDGADFLAWQRNAGLASGTTVRQGDATADGDVDENDLAVWRERYGDGGAGQGASDAVSDPLSTVSQNEQASRELAERAQRAVMNGLNGAARRVVEPRRLADAAHVGEFLRNSLPRFGETRVREDMRTRTCAWHASSISAWDAALAAGDEDEAGDAASLSWDGGDAAWEAFVVDDALAVE